MKKTAALPYIFSILFLITGYMTHAQEAQFSQFYASSLFLNPAFAGATNGLSISANVRVQPLTATVSNELQQVSIQTPVYAGSASENKLVGVGLTLLNQTMGAGRAFKTMGALLAVSKPISFDLLVLSQLSLAFKVG